MIKSEFSERLFETLINHEILCSLGCDIYIPTQAKESQSGLDALFQGRKRKILALQYKVVNQYDKIPNYLKAPAFQFNLHYDEKGYTQHNHLAKKSIRGLNAFYAVPAFVGYKELYNNYHLKTLLDNSYLISPGREINDKKHHYINFDTNSTAYLHSKEKVSVQLKTLSDLPRILEECDSYSKDSLVQLLSDDATFTSEETQNKIVQKEQQGISFLWDNKIILLVL